MKGVKHSAGPITRAAGFNPRRWLWLVGLALIALWSGGWAPLTCAAATNTTPLLQEGRAALEDELYELAQKKIERFLKSEAHSAEELLTGKLLLAQALHGQQRYPEMLTLLESAGDPPPTQAAAEHLVFWMALACFETGQWERTLHYLQNFEQAYPGSPYHPRVLRLRAWSFLQLGRQAEAIECFARFADQYGNSPEGPANMLDGAKALLAAGQTATAREVLEKLAALNLDNRIGQEGRSLLGRIYFSTKHWEQARQIVAPLREHKNVPDQLRLEALSLLAEIAQAHTNPVQALSLLDQGREQITDPELQAEIDLRRGQILLDMGKIEEGAALVRGFVSARTSTAAAEAAQIELAEKLLADGRNAKALIEFQNYLETFADPIGLSRAQRGKGWALANAGRYLEAAAAFEKAYSGAPSPPDKAFAQFKAAEARFAGGQYQLALELSHQLRTQFPETLLAEQALLQMAECYVRLGQQPEAERLLWDVADQDRGGAQAERALLRLAELRLQQGREAASRDLYLLILAEGDGSAQARALLGLANLDYRHDDFQAALAQYRQILDQFPQSASAARAAYLSAWCWARLGQEEAALAAFRDFVDSYPHSPWAAEALFWLAEQDYNHGWFEQAEKIWKQLAQAYPQAIVADQALFWAGRAALKQNEFRRARDCFSALIKNYPASSRLSEARFYQGEALCELGEFAGAILIFDEIIRQFPDSDLAEVAWLRKGDSQFALGTETPRRYEEALAAYRQISPRS